MKPIPGKRKPARRTKRAAVTLEPIAPRPVSLIVEPVNAIQFAALVHAAQTAIESVDRFVQLHDPTDRDVAALETLRAALSPYLHYRAPAQ